MSENLLSKLTEKDPGPFYVDQRLALHPPAGRRDPHCSAAQN